MRLLSLRNVCCVALLAASAVACGGAVFGSRDDSGDGGSSSAGSSHGGTSSTAGKPSKGGSSSTAGASTMGGRSGTAGTSNVAGMASAGAPGCTLLPCMIPQCADGQMPITPAGDCCPSCPPPATGCENVKCQPVKACGEGEVLQQPAGACCAACVPKQPGNVACLEIACPDDDQVCPLGYVRGDKVGGCCYQCLPDPLFCNQEKECVMADRPRSCCGCPEVISRRAYDADACWSDVTAPRMIPQSCYPQVVCDALCGACPAPLPVECIDHRCATLYLK